MSVLNLPLLEQIGGSLQYGIPADPFSFPKLRSIGASCGFSNLKAITTDLPLLETVGEDLTFGNLDSTQNLHFPLLHSVGDKLSFNSLDEIVEINFASITSLDEDLSVFVLPKLERLILSSITKIGGEINFSQSRKLSSIDLSSLDSIGQNFEFFRMDALTTLSDFENLKYIGGDVSIQENAVLQNFGNLNNLRTVEGNLTIIKNPVLENVNSLNALSNIGENFELLENPTFKNMDGLTALQTIGASLEISKNNTLEQIDGLQNLTSIGNALDITQNDSLRNITGLASVTSIGFYITVTGNCVLENIDGLIGLTMAPSWLSVGGHPLMQNLDGLRNLTRVEGDLSLSSNGQVQNFDMLGNLTSVGGSCSILNNERLEQLNGLANLIAVGEDLGISQNERMTDISGLRNVKEIGDDLIIDFNDSLKVINFTGLEMLGGDITISSNRALTSISGFQNFETLLGSFDLSNALYLQDLNFLSNLKTVNGDFRYYNILSLPDLAPLANLNTVNGDFFIALTRLQSLDGLENLNFIDGQLRIQSNEQLEDCCAIQLLISTPGAITDGTLISSNPSECSSQAEIIEATCAENRFITGNIFVDWENTTCIDSNPYFNLNVVQDLNDYAYFSNAEGAYKISLNAVGLYQVTPKVESDYYNISPNNLMINYPADTANLAHDFCLSKKGEFDDLEITLSPTGMAQSGFDATYKLLVRNKGTTTLDGNVEFFFEGELVTYKTALPAPQNISDNALTWNFQDLLPFETREYQITLTLNGPNDNPPVMEGTVLNYTATVTHSSNEETPEDNVTTLNQEAVNAFDPNDKTCLLGKILKPEMVGEFITYQIRFENTGNAPARNVRIIDTLDQNSFDISSFKILDASHELKANISDGNVVEFVFENINLPFDGDNKGYVLFKIKSLSTLDIGDQLKNQAFIYFDFNSPIATNTAITTVDPLSSINNNSINHKLSLHPNPSEELINLRLASDSSVLNYFIYSSLGEQIHHGTTSNKLINIRTLKAGTYFLTIIDGNGNSYVAKFVKM